MLDPHQSIYALEQELESKKRLCVYLNQRLRDVFKILEDEYLIDKEELQILLDLLDKKREDEERKK